MLALGDAGAAAVSSGGGNTGSGKVSAGKAFSMAGAVAASTGSEAGVALLGASSGLSAVAKRAVAPELADGGAITFATGVCLRAVTGGKALKSTEALGGGADKRRCTTGAAKGVSRTLSEERVCKPSKCKTNTNTTKPHTQGLVKGDDG